MTWARFDDGFCQHPKIIGLSDGAFRLHVAGVCYASRNLTDGRIPAAALPSLRHRAYFRCADELVAAGIWERDGQWFVIHDYLHYNPSAVDVHSKRNSKAMAGAKGAASRWHDRQNAPGPDPSPTRNSSSSVAGARSARQWWEHVTGNVLKDKAQRQQLDDIQAAHGFDCVAWCFTASIGKDNPWMYAKRIFDSCLLEGHGPRGGNGGRNGIRPQGSGDHRRKQGKPDGRDTDWAAVSADLERERREAGWYDGDETGTAAAGVEQDV